MKNRFYHLTAAVLLLPLLLFGCGGAEDGDLTPPAFTFDGIQSPTSVPDGHSLSGTVGPDATIEVDVTTTATISNLSVGGGSWSFDVDGLVEGLNTISIDVSDPIGNSTVYFVNIILDTTGPTVTLKQFTTPTPNGQQVLAGTVAELDATVEISTDGGLNWAPADDVDGGIWVFAVDLVDGTYDIWVRGIDRLGNKPTDPADELIVKEQIVVNAAADTLTITEDDDGAIYLADPDIEPAILTLNGTRTSDYSVGIIDIDPASSLSVDDETDPVNWTATFSDLPSGATEATFGLFDLADIEVARAKVLVVRDLSGPLLIETEPVHGDVGVATDAPIVLTFSETMTNIENDGTLFELVADDGTTVSFSNDPTTTDFRTFSFTPDSLLQPETKYTVNFIDASTAVVEDIYGNDFVRPTGLWVFTTAP